MKIPKNQPKYEIILTVTVRAGKKLPKSSNMVITAKFSKIAQKQLERPPLKFKDEFFGALKMFEKNFFFGVFDAYRKN